MKFPKLLMAGLLSLGTIAVSAVPSIANINSNEKLIAQNHAAPEQSLTDSIDFYTDHFFYAANPELNKRKLRSSDQTYIQEWKALRKAITPFVKPASEACKRPGSANLTGWDFDLNHLRGSSAYDYLADVIFYHRNPQFNGQKLRPKTREAQEWSAISRQMFVYTCGM